MSQKIQIEKNQRINNYFIKEVDDPNELFSNKKKTICATLNLVFASTVKYFQFFERTVQKRSH